LAAAANIRQQDRNNTTASCFHRSQWNPNIASPTRATTVAADSRTFASLLPRPPHKSHQSCRPRTQQHHSHHRPQECRRAVARPAAACRRSGALPSPFPRATSPTALALAPHASEAAEALPAAVAHHHRPPKTAPLRADWNSHNTAVSPSSPRHPRRLCSTWPPAVDPAVARCGSRKPRLLPARLLQGTCAASASQGRRPSTWPPRVPPPRTTRPLQGTLPQPAARGARPAAAHRGEELAPLPPSLLGFPPEPPCRSDARATFILWCVSI
jgi:hypothetical protein